MKWLDFVTILISHEEVWSSELFVKKRKDLHSGLGRDLYLGPLDGN